MHCLALFTFPSQLGIWTLHQTTPAEPGRVYLEVKMAIWWLWATGLSPLGREIGPAEKRIDSDAQRSAPALTGPPNSHMEQPPLESIREKFELDSAAGQIVSRHGDYYNDHLPESTEVRCA